MFKSILRLRAKRRRRRERPERLSHFRPLRFEPLESRKLLAAIEVFAAGATGEEAMTLEVNGVAVETWTNVAGDYDAPVYESFAVDYPGPVEPGQVRVAFVNDGLTATGADRNLRVDRIEIDGDPYESESSTVLSTGTWAVGTGCDAGFKQSEVLHCNGYFQYPNLAGSVVEVHAAGATGEETMDLLIDGVPVETWTSVGGDYDNGQYQVFQFNASTVVTPDQIRVAFVNDGLTSAGGDKNLRVDHVTIDGVVYETESETVESTGTYTAADGCAAGFKQSEFLHCAGYFQFAALGGSTIEVRAAGATGEETMELQIDGVAVQTWTNIGGDYQAGVFETFQHASSETILPSQVRVAFTNNGYTSGGGDKNIRVDGITLDGLVYEAEASNVESTGTWSSDTGCSTGFKQSELLHCDGYFQFGDPSNGVFGLATSVVNALEGDDSVSVTISRTSGTAGTATVDYRTIAGTAADGNDYVGQSGSAVFAPGTTSITIDIPLVDNAVAEDNETFSFTIDNVTGGGQLLTPRTAIITIRDDDLPAFGTFAAPAPLALNGDALLTDGVLRLTPALNMQRGSAFFDQPMPIGEDTSFQTAFSFQLDGGDAAEGGDGFVFMMQNDAAGLNALSADDGESLGYEGILNSLAVEFDTFQNAFDTSGNQVSILANGDMANTIAFATPAEDLNDGSIWHAWVDYAGASDTLAVYLSTTNEKPADPLLTALFDLPLVVGSQAYLGFSAATGGLANQHDILDWTYVADSPPDTTVPTPANVSVQTVVSGLIAPTSIDWTPDGSKLYVAEKSGVVHVLDSGDLLPTPFIDISPQVNDVRDRGLLDLAVHPDFAANPYVYLLFTYDPPEVFDHIDDPLAGPDKVGNRAGRLIRVTADAATDYTTAIPGSEVVLLGENSVWSNFNAFANSTIDFAEPPAGILPNGDNIQDFIASDSESHSVGAVEFAADGSLFVSTGDGASYNQVDPRAIRVQDIDNLSGKILRIDPVTGDGLASNPYYDGNPDANRSKVYQYGLRNPFRMSVDSVTGQLYVGDVGWATWEEVNAGNAGDNFGWPYYEGGNDVAIRTPGYQDLPEAQAFYASSEVTAVPLLALNHAAVGINAIVVGDVYDGVVYPAEFNGDVFFNDLGQGVVRNLTLDGAGGVESLSVFETDALIVVQIKQGPDDLMYFVDLDDGVVGRWVFD